MEGDQWNDHRDEFETFVCHSFLPAHRILAEALSKCQSQTAGIWLAQLDQNCEELARTIESKIKNPLDTSI